MWLDEIHQDLVNDFDLADTLLYADSFGLMRVISHIPNCRQMVLIEQLEDAEERCEVVDFEADYCEIITLVKKPIEQVGKTTLYIGAPTGKKAEECLERKIGTLLTPEMFRNNAKNPIFGYDNGVFAQFKKAPEAKFDGTKFLHHLHMMQERGVYPDFVVIPDMIAKGPEASLELSLEWIPKLREFSFPIYFVLQDGMTESMLDEHGISHLVDGFFLGGAPTFQGYGKPQSKVLEWKLKTGEAWVKYAHKHNKRIHIGRVSSIRRLKWARAINADSADTSQAVFDNKIWERYMREMRANNLPL